MATLVPTGAAFISTSPGGSGVSDPAAQSRETAGSVTVVLQLFAESVGEPRKAAHSHPHWKILALHEWRANVLRIWQRDDGKPGVYGGRLQPRVRQRGPRLRAAGSELGDASGGSPERASAREGFSAV